MKICSDNHDEICYTENKCPCCELIKERDNWKDQFSDLEDESANEIEELQDQIKELQDK